MTRGMTARTEELIREGLAAGMDRPSSADAIRQAAQGRVWRCYIDACNGLGWKIVPTADLGVAERVCEAYLEIGTQEQLKAEIVAALKAWRYLERIDPNYGGTSR